MLQQALAEPEGYVRTFVDKGAPRASLLRLALAHGVVPGYVGRLLAAFEAQPTAEPGAAPPTEPLSERELEVLRLMAAGLSNREIAETLLLAEGTVKRHTHNIFGKLGVRGRTQVLLRARELRLLHG